MLNKHKKAKILVIIIGVIIIPVFSVLFGLNGDLIDMTFSQVGGRLEGKLETLIIWGILVSSFFYFCIDYMFMMMKKKSPLVMLVLGLGCIALLTTVFLPFNTVMYPISSEIHNNLARIAIIFIILAIILFISEIKSHDKKTYIISLSVFLVCFIILIILFFKYEVSSIFQIIFASSMSCFLVFEFILIEKSKGTNLQSALKLKLDEVLRNKPSNAFSEEIESAFKD